MELDPKDLLWHDRSLLAARHEKAARALVGVHRVLARSRPLGGREDEFLALYRWILEVDPGAFTRVWADPYAYFWLRVTWEALRSLQSGAALAPLAEAHLAPTDPVDLARALARHLGEFKRLAVGAALVVGCDIELDVPLRLSLPATLPGTSLVLSGNGPSGTGTLELDGLRGGSLCGRVDGVDVSLPLDDGPTQAGPLRVRHCPVVRTGGCEIRMQPLAFAISALDTGLAPADATLEMQQANRGLLEASLEIVRHHQPDTFEQIAEHVRVVAFRRRIPGSYRNNLTNADVPGAILVSAIPNPVWIAHVLVHEFHHNRLFCLEEQGPFFQDSSAAAHDAHFASPWRPDPRPLHGILHGLYVHVPVAHFWLALLEADIDEPTRSLAVDRALRSWHQNRFATGELQRHARFTPFGQRLFDQLRADVAALGVRIRALGLPDDAPAFVCRDDGSPAPRSDATHAVTVRAEIAAHLRSLERDGAPL